jgi:hypothetical protein
VQIVSLSTENALYRAQTASLRCILGVKPDHVLLSAIIPARGRREATACRSADEVWFCPGTGDRVRCDAIWLAEAVTVRRRNATGGTAAAENQTTVAALRWFM